MKTRVVFGAELYELAHRITREAIESGRDPQAFMAPAILIGDRITCCDEGVVFVDDALRGIATIAPEGEGRDGTPTIVGVFVRHLDRRRGYGSVLLEAAVRRCLERGFQKIRIDTLTKGSKRVVDKLPPDLIAYLDVHDQSHITLF